jgi:hypothetical protein
MNPKSLLFATIFLCTLATAQSEPETHDGFFLAFGLGTAFGHLETDITERFGSFTNSGYGPSFDARIGGGASGDLIFHATLLGDRMLFPTQQGPDERTGTYFKQLGLNLFGVGCTKYFMPANAFVSASGGMAQILFHNRQTTEVQSVDGDGLGLQIKAGKEWWVSPDWGIGVAIHFEFAHLTSYTYEISRPLDTRPTTVTETDTYTNLGIQFSATFQ